MIASSIRQAFDIVVIEWKWYSPTPVEPRVIVLNDFYRNPTSPKTSTGSQL